MNQRLRSILLWIVAAIILVSVFNTFGPPPHSSGAQPHPEAYGNPSLAVHLLNFLPWAVLLAIWILVLRKARKSKVKLQEKIKFEDLSAVLAAKEKVQEYVEILRNPGSLQASASKAMRGVLLAGSSSSSKLLLAKVIAGEAGVQFVSKYDLNVFEKSELMGVSAAINAALILAMLGQAKKLAPCVVYFDDFDFFSQGELNFASRGRGGKLEKSKTRLLQQLFKEMDNYKGNGTILVLAGTSNPNMLDPMILQPGHFDRQVLVSP